MCFLSRSKVVCLAVREWGLAVRIALLCDGLLILWCVREWW